MIKYIWIIPNWYYNNISLSFTAIVHMTNIFTILTQKTDVDRELESLNTSRTSPKD